MKRPPDSLRLRMGYFDDRHFEHLVLDEAPPAMVVSKRHPMAGEKAELTDFRNDHFLVLSEIDSGIPNSYTYDLFRRNGLEPKQISVYDQPETILMLIHSDAGVALLSRFAATDQFDDLEILDLDIEDKICLELVWRKEDTDRNIQCFAEKMGNSHRNS